MQSTPSFKLVLIGECGVGKTSLFNRVRENRFCSEAEHGVELCNTELCLDQGLRIRLALWDTAGVERFRTLTRNYYRHCHCALLTCCLDDKASLDNLCRWNQDVEFYCKDCVKVIVVNKSDLAGEITADQLQNFASTFGCQKIFHVSAKTGDGVSEMLAGAARLLLDAHHPGGKRRPTVTSEHLGSRDRSSLQRQQQQQQQSSAGPSNKTVHLADSLGGASSTASSQGDRGRKSWTSACCSSS